MKKLILFLICAVISAGFMCLASCSKPLNINEIDQVTPDTLYVSDTIVFIDTIYVDTIFIDTIFVDTAFADTFFCARLSSQRQEIVWMLFNQEGPYQLEFQALPERTHSQTLIIDIDGQRFSWVPSDSRDFTIETELEQNALIRIASIPPHAFGQAVDICLRVGVR